MSNVVFVSAGQCGNQLGYSILSKLNEQLSGQQEDGSENVMEMDFFFRSSGNSQTKKRARCVCLDTEPKAVNQCLARARRETNWSFDKGSVAYRHGGAGNNWAVGYKMCSGEFLETSVDCIRREIEHCDNPATLLTVHSVGGGTGSGLGTKITEAARDEFPDATLINIAVAPYHFSEVVVQHYNSLLCLSKITAAAHAVMMFENETAQDLCKTMRRISRPTLDDINQTLTSNILPVILPKQRQNSTLYSSLHHDIIHLCPHPSFKFLDAKLTPQTAAQSVDFTFDSWGALLKNVDSMQAAGLASESSASTAGRRRHASRSPGTCVNLSSLLVAHGLGSVHAADECITSIRKSRSLLHATWADAEDSYKICTSAHFVNGYQRSLCLISNGQTVLPYLKRMLVKASELFKVGAYIHQYTAEAGGIQVEDFVDAFRNLGQTVEDYKAIRAHY